MQTINTRAPITVSVRDVFGILRTHSLTPDFGTVDGTLHALAERLTYRISHLYTLGSLTPATITDAKSLRAEIKGGIELLAAVADCHALQQALRDDADYAFDRAVERLRPTSKAAKTLNKWGADACRKAWEMNRLRGEGLTVCSIESGIPIRSVSAAIDAWNALGVGSSGQ